MKYLPLLELHLSHPYYADGRCTDFAVEPTPAAQQLLKNHRCVLKSVPDGLRVMIMGDDQGAPLIPLPADATFGFLLRLQNPDFALFTDLTAYRQQAAPLYTHTAAPGNTPVELTLESRQTFATEGLVSSQPAPAEHFRLSGRPQAGLDAADFTVAGLTGVTALVDYDAVTKLVGVNTAAASQGQAFALTYPAEAPIQTSFAGVEIHCNAPVQGQAAQFHISFGAKQARWNYYLVTDRPDGTFTVRDTSTPPIQFGAEALTDPPSVSDTVAQSLAAQFPTLRRFRFVSAQPVSCQAVGRKSIQLQLNGSLVRDALPNPPLGNFTLTPSAGGGQEEALYQVIQYLTP